MPPPATRPSFRPSGVASLLTVCAGGLTGLAAARPTASSIANAVLFWAWAASAWRFTHRKVTQVVCHACGAEDPMRLPDGSCATCAAPVGKSFPDLARAKADDAQSSSS